MVVSLTFVYSIWIAYLVFVVSFSQAVVLEGKYWKRRLESVTLEYKKWRVFYKEKGSRLVSKLTEKDRLEVSVRCKIYEIYYSELCKMFYAE